MKRKAIDKLIKWKELNTNRPVLLIGAKGVGKTYLAYDFAKAFFEGIYYLNFEREPFIRTLFESQEMDTIIEQLTLRFGLSSEMDPFNQVLILDEINYCTKVLSWIQEPKVSEIFRYIIMISSNPVSREFTQEFQQLAIFPLDFDEFLRATNNEWYIELIINHFNTNTKIPEIVHKELLDLHQLYLKIGGMPGAINEYLNLSSLINVAEQHNFLIGAYHDSIIRDNSDTDALKMNQVFDSLVSQLMKENKKFQYKLIRKGTTHSMYKDAIQKLSDIDYVIRCNRIRTEQLLEEDNKSILQESSAEDTNSNFKLYMPDTGLLYTKIMEEYGDLADMDFKRTILENYVAQSLQANYYPFGFWESDSMAKIDFLIYKEEAIMPIEIFESCNTRSKSISILKQKCDFEYAIKISSKNFEFSNQIKYVPYYAIFCI